MVPEDIKVERRIEKVKENHINKLLFKVNMEIKDLTANQGNIDLVLEVVEKEPERTFDKFGKSGRVCNVKVKDSSGDIKLTLWNEDIDTVNVGDKIHLQNGWCSEFRGEKQISSGKFGKIEVVEKATSSETPPQPAAPETKEAEEDEEPLTVEEEMVG